MVAAAFVTVGYALAILVVSGYSATFDKPADPVGVVLCLALAIVPVVVVATATGARIDAGWPEKHSFEGWR